MKADTLKLKLATEVDLIRELSLIDEELSNDMHPVSWARCKKLIEYKKEIQSELNNR